MSNTVLVLGLCSSVATRLLWYQYSQKGYVDVPKVWNAQPAAHEVFACIAELLNFLWSPQSHLPDQDFQDHNEIQIFVSDHRI